MDMPRTGLPPNKRAVRRSAKLLITRLYVALHGHGMSSVPVSSRAQPDGRRRKLPAWADYGLLPLLNLSLAFLVSGLVVVLLGREPAQGGRDPGLRRVRLWRGGGLHALLRHQPDLHRPRGGRGLSMPGCSTSAARGRPIWAGSGSGWWGSISGWLPGILSIPLAVLAAALFGGVWGLIPGWLQARRGSHVVITTIMLNFVASALMTYLMVNVLIKPGQSAPESITFAGDGLDAVAEGPVRPARRRFRLRAGQPLPGAGAAVLRRHVAVRLAQPDRLRAARGRPQRAGRGLWRHLARAAGSSWP